MIAQVTGILTSITTAGKSAAAMIELPMGLTFEVLLPAFLAEHYRGQTGLPVTMVTFCYFEGQGQGTSFVPRVLGFRSAKEREFFDLFTSVSGIGYRKALRAMAKEPAAIASSIHLRDAKGLKELPEIGQKMAELIITELHEKVLPFLDGTVPTAVAKGAGFIEPTRTKLAPGAEDAVGALCALGETRVDAERMVIKAMERQPSAQSADELVALVFAGKR